MFQVKVTNSMFIAHSLPDESFGPAQNLHGATYTIDLFISSNTLTDKNIVIDIDIASKILSEIVKKYNCGFVAKDFEIKSMINLLNNLDTDHINQAKLSSAKASKELCFENESKFLLNKILKKTY